MDVRLCRSGIVRPKRASRFLTVGALLLAFVAQILAPWAASNALAFDPAMGGRIAICSAKGIHYVYPDGRQADIPGENHKPAVKSCPYCLPLIAGGALKSADSVLVPLLAQRVSGDVPAVFLFASGEPRGDANPRAPPATPTIF